MTMFSPKRSPRSIMFMWISVIMLVSGVTIALFTTLLVYYRTTDVIEATDARLLMAAEMAREIIGPEYHNLIDTPSSISPEQFNRIVERNDDLCRRLHLQYLWSVLYVEGQFVFTSATHSDIGNPTSPSAAFFEVHRDPESFLPAMGAEMNPVFSSFHNEWGEGRMVLIPRKDTHGRTYIFGASVQMNEYNAMLWQAVLVAIAIGLAVMGGAFLLTLTLARRLIIPITQLTKTADKMAGGDLEVSLPDSGNRELQSLSDSLDRLRHGLKKRIKELNKSNALLDATQQLTKVGGWEWDVAQQSMFWTAETYRIHGFSPDEISPGSTEHIARSILCYEPDARPIIQAAFQDCVEKGLPYSLEVAFTNLQGERMWVCTQAEAVRENDKIVRAVGIIIDITARKLDEEAKRKSEAEYQRIVNTAREGIWAMNAERKITFVNTHMATLLGYEPDEMLGHSVEDFMFQEDLVDHFTRMQDRKKGQGGQYEHRFVAKDGREVWAIVSATAIMEDNGEFAGSFAMFTEITDRKHAEELLRQSSATTQALINAATESIFLIDADGIVLAANTTAVSRLGKHGADLVGANIYDLLPPAVAAARRERTAIVLAEGKPSCFEDERWGAWIENNIYPVFDADGIARRVAVFGRDVTDRKNMLATLAREVDFNQLIFNSVDAEMVVVGSDGVILAINEPWRKFALENAALDESSWGVGANYFVKFDEEWGDTNLAMEGFEGVRKVQRGRLPSFNLEYPCHGPGNKKRWFVMQVVPLQGKDGTVLVSHANITERKLAEQALLVREEQYRRLIEILHSGVVVHAPNTEILLANQRASTLLGLSLEQMQGKVAIDPAWFFVREDNSRLPLDEYPVMATIARHQPLENFVVGIVQPTGKRIWVLVNTYPDFDDNHQLRQVVVTFMDMTERKRAEEIIHADQVELQRLLAETERSRQALLSVVEDQKEAQEQVRQLNAELEQRVKERTAQVQDLYDNAPAGYHSLDADGRFILINQTELNWLGCSRDEVIGRLLTDFLTDSSIALFQQIFPSFKQHGLARDYEMEFVRKGGTTFLALVNATAIHDLNGKFLMSRETVVDITERKQAERALQESEAQLRVSWDRLSAANEALEKAARMKDEFLASMSHELRTPLTGILGLSEALQAHVYGPLNDKQLRSLANIEISGKHLLELINDILDVSKLEAGMLELQFEPCSLGQICLASLNLVKGMAQKKNQNISFSMAPTDILFQADSRHFKQILVNLLSNAVKYTQAGGSLGLDVEGCEQEHTIQISVWDQGIGIKAEDLDRIFQPFVQIDGSLARQQTGTGLGLALVQHLVDLHSGSISVESTFGKGSRFTVTLPWVSPNLSANPSNLARESDLPQPTAMGQNRDSGVAPGRGMATSTQTNTSMVLVVDDNKISRTTIIDFLSSSGFRVAAADDAAEFIEQLSHELPDLVLMDIQMPRIDGLEAIRWVRAHPDAQIARIPVIALTALAMPGDREKCIAAGANEYLSKPVGLQNLAAIIQTMVNKNR